MLRNMMKALLVASLLAMAGCVNETSELLDCLDVCDHYDACVGGGLDSEACTDICEDNSDRSDAFEDQVDLCENCLTEAACSPSCNNLCSGIIPDL